MEFFLNVAIPSVEPAVEKPNLWSKHNKNHVDFFGDTWRFEFATAMLLVTRFSALDNIRHNLARKKNKENTEPDGAEPKRKRRKKMQTRANQDEMQNCYFAAMEFAGNLMEKPGFFDRMEKWDQRCCKETRSRKGAGEEAAARANTVPMLYRQIDSEDSGFAKKFFAGLGPGWSMASTISDSGSPCSPSIAGGALFTQSPDDTHQNVIRL